MASIRELRGKWQVQIRLKGFPAVVETFDRKTDAKLWAAATESSMREGRWFPRRVATDRTLADAIDRFVADHLPGRGAAITLRSHSLATMGDRLRRSTFTRAA